MNLLEQIRNISGKKIILLSTLTIFIGVIVYLSILSNASETVAFTPFNTEKFSNMLKYRAQDLNEIVNDQFSEISAKDKELAYIYLMKKLKTKDIVFIIYKVKNGENFWQVAKKFRINIDTIIGVNPELKTLTAKLNQEIIVPLKKGVIHEVKDKEETLDLLSELYSIDKEKIKKINNMKNEKLKIGDVLFIPDAKPVYMTKELSELYQKRNMFRSPLFGVYTSLFGSRIHPVTGEQCFHEAVDIRAKIGTWVGAAADGVVTFAGWDGNLGYCVKISHKDGYSTLYGHLSKIYVKPGQKVKAGKLIAKTGNTGRTTGPHLHFAIYKNGVAQNPLKYLW